jgi:hypothetical protein
MQDSLSVLNTGFVEMSAQYQISGLKLVFGQPFFPSASEVLTEVLS